MAVKTVSLHLTAVGVHWAEILQSCHSRDPECPLFLFVFSGIVARVILAVHGNGTAGQIPIKVMVYEAIASLPLSAENASLTFAVLFNLAMFGVAWFMWRMKWFVKV